MGVFRRLAATDHQVSQVAKSDLIQVMRFVAATMVVYSHHTLYVRERIDSSFSVSFLGPPGVALFFMISGLVMVLSSRKLSRDWAGAREFMTRRLLRIVPLYWVATFLKIAVAIALPHMVIHNTFDPVYALKSLLFIPVFNPAGSVTPILGVGWSLVHEMYFYLVFALAMWLGGRSPLWPALAVSGVVVYGQFVHAESAAMQMATNTVNGYFVIGMAMAAVMARESQTRAWSVALAAVLCGLGVVKWLHDPFMLPFIVQPWAFVLAGVILLLHDAVVPRLLTWTVKLGDSSYALYLFHTFFGTPLVLALHYLAPTANLMLKVVVSTMISVVIGHVLHLVLEKRLNRWVAALFGRKAA